MERVASELAPKFHEAYERLAPQFGYETRKDSAVPWEQVPERNRQLMTAVCKEVVAAALAACAREAKLEEAKQAEKLLDRYREKARLLVIQTGGSYDSGEAIQFLVSDYEKYKQHVRALERAVGEKA